MQGGSYHKTWLHPWDVGAQARTRTLLARGSWAKGQVDRQFVFKGSFFDGGYHNGGGQWRRWIVVIDLRDNAGGAKNFQNARGVVTCHWTETLNPSARRY